MKKYIVLLTAAVLALQINPALAQFGGSPGDFKFGGALKKVFGDNSAFTAMLSAEVKPKTGDAIVLPGKVAFDDGKARFEINMSSAMGSKLPAGAAEQMKAMGLDQMTTIALPDKKVLYLIYPNLQSYVENPMPDAGSGTNENYKVATTELGKATVDGHPCVENKVVVTDDKGKASEFTVWNATDLKNFPVKIVHAEKDTEITMSFKDISMTKPAASSFAPPTGYTRYDSMQGMIQAVMMKKMAGGLGAPK
ncbi:MAG: hypothetical protein WDN00_01225 [Limisphaerales bacterium]